jgi:abortive infection bacteriophage resistance protein
MGGRSFERANIMKRATTLEEQLAILRERGCVINDEAFSREVLLSVGYYRLSAYFSPFRAGNSSYSPGVEFSHVYKLYEFDRKLRSLIFAAVEELEVYLRATFTYCHVHEFGSVGYLNPENYNQKHNHTKFKAMVDELIRNNKQTAFVRHHIAHYDGEFPLWAMMELFTFGMLSRFFADMPTSLQKIIARIKMGCSVADVKSWLYCCTALRNICAHTGILYGRVFSSVPARIPYVGKSCENSLFAVLMALRALFPNAQKWNNEFMSAIMALFEEYSDAISFNYIGFPDNWPGLMQKPTKSQYAGV